MRDRIRSWMRGYALLQTCALIALPGCGRSSPAPNAGVAKNQAQVRPMLVPPPPGQAQPPGEPCPIEKYLYPPDFIMVHQRDAGITDDQREAILTVVQEGQAKILRLQWEMQEAMSQIEQELAKPRVDEAKVLGASDSITKLEGEIKKTHLAMLIRIKNRLSEEQQRRLTEMRIEAIRKPR